MIATPFLMKATARIRREPVRGSGEVRPEPENDHANAVVIGYGRFGQTVAQTLMSGGVSVTLVDNKVQQIDLSGEFGSKVYYGDGTRIDILRQAGAGDAQLIMFCISDEHIEPGLIASVTQAFPNAAVYLRTYDRLSVMRLHGNGETFLMREMFESALRMALMALEEVGLSQEELDSAEDTYRQSDWKRLERQLEEGNMHAAREHIVTEPRERGPRRKSEDIRKD